MKVEMIKAAKAEGAEWVAEIQDREVGDIFYYNIFSAEELQQVREEYTRLRNFNIREVKHIE